MSAPMRRSLGSRASTAPERNRPAESRLGRACRAGSRGPCSGGRRRAGPGDPWSKLVACRAPSPTRRSSERRSQSIPRRRGSPWAVSSKSICSSLVSAIVSVAVRALEVEGQLHAILALVGDHRASGALLGGAFLAGDDPVRQPDEQILRGSLGDPHPARADQGSPGAADRERERSVGRPATSSSSAARAVKRRSAPTDIRT